MIRSGLASITFRQLSVAEIVAATRAAQLAGIEWGGDIHVPPGDLARARETRQRTLEAGLAVSSYGSYFRLGEPDFSRILETATALDAPTIRVWAGRQGSAETSDADRQTIVAAAHEIGEQARAAELTIGLEMHAGTLTDTPASAARLLTEIQHPNVRLYWQPYHFLSPDENLASIDLLAPWLSNFHVFHWSPDTVRFPLADGADRWRAYLQSAGNLAGDRWALLEFSLDDNLSVFQRDAIVLKDLVDQTTMRG